MIMYRFSWHSKHKRNDLEHYEGFGWGRSVLSCKRQTTDQAPDKYRDIDWYELIDESHTHTFVKADHDHVLTLWIDREIV